MAEALEYISEDEENETKVVDFIKKFNKLKPKEAKELRQQIESLGIIKIKPEYIIKVIDILPENIDELNKIFADVTLEEDEANRILEEIKKFK